MYVGLVDEVSCVVSLPSLSLLVDRFVGDVLLDFGIHNGGSLFSVTIPNPTSSLLTRVGLLPRCLGVVCALSLAVTDFKSSMTVKNPSLNPSARRFPATRICGDLTESSNSVRGVTGVGPPCINCCSNFVNEFCRTCS